MTVGYLRDATTGAAFDELPDGASAAISAAGKVRTRNNGGILEASEDGGPYGSLSAAGSAQDASIVIAHQVFS